MKRCFALSLFATTCVLGGCRTMGDTRDLGTPSAARSASAGATPIADASATTSASAAGDAGAAPAIAPRPREDRGWNTFPDANSGALSYVVDGYCTLMDVSFLGDTTILKYGEHSAGTVARVASDGAIEDVERLSRNDPGAFKYDSVVGTYPDAMFWPVNLGGRSYERPAIARYSEDKGWITPKMEDPPMTFVGRYGAGVLVQRRSCSNSSDDCKPAGIVALGEKTPPLASDGYEVHALHVWPDKTLVSVGSVCSGDPLVCANEARWIGADGARKTFRLGTDLTSGTMVARSTNDVLVAFADGTMFKFDGAKWSPMANEKSKDGRFGLFGRSADGATWAERSGHVLRRKSDDAKWEDVSPPLDKRGAAFQSVVLEGLEFGMPYAVMGERLFHAKEDGGSIKWDEIAIPKPPFSSRKTPPRVAYARVKNANEVWVNVTYTENYGDPLRFEQRRAFLKTGPVHETLRCQTRENTMTDSRRGFESWPPRADETCKTPAVVVGRGKLDKDAFPRSRALLKGKKDLGVVELVEVSAPAGVPYVVARVGSFEAAKKLSSSLLGKVYNLPPEMVCAEPKGERVRVDAATGTVVAN